MSEILIAYHLMKTWTADQFMGSAVAAQVWAGSTRQNSANNEPAIKDVTFSVEAGEIFGLVGPSGSGKSTLLGLLSGQLSPDSGRIELFGQELKPAEPGRARISNKVCLISKMTSSQAFNRMGAVDNLLYVARLQGINGAMLNPAALQDRVRMLLAALGLSQAEMAQPLSEAHFSTLLKVVIGRALISLPRLLLVDEITDGMDLETRTQVLDVLKSYCKEFGMTIILATRSLRTAAQVCDRISFLSRGQMSHLIERESPLRSAFSADQVKKIENDVLVDLPACELQPA